MLIRQPYSKMITTKRTTMFHDTPKGYQFTATFRDDTPKGFSKRQCYGSTPAEAKERLQNMLTDLGIEWTDGTTSEMDRGIIQGEFL